MERRRHLRRAIGVALVALLVWFLLQANRLLPGSWPGGGDAGSRATPVAPKDDPTRVREAGAPPPPVRKPPEPVRIVVRAPDGTPVPGAVVVPSIGEAERIPRLPEPVEPPDAETESKRDVPLEPPLGIPRGRPDPASDPDDGVPDHGFLVRLSPRGAGVRHSSPPSHAPRTWTVAWPQAAIFSGSDFERPGFEPETLAASRTATPSILVRADGRPVAGAQVAIEARSEEMAKTTDRDGRVSLEPSLGLYRARVTAPGRAEAIVYGSTGMRSPLVIELDSMLHVATRLVASGDRAPLGAKAVRIVSEDGTVREIERAEETIREVRLDVPSRIASHQWLEVEVEGRPVVRVSLAEAGAELAIPAGRNKRIVVRDASGAPVKGAKVEARYAAPAGREPLDAAEPATTHVTDADGVATVPLPQDRSADLVVLSDRHAPYGLRTDPGDAAESVATLSAGVAVVVEVVDASGKPVEGANVIAIARAGPTATRRRARSGADGRATLPPVATGRLELYVHKPGFAWDRRVVDVTDAKTAARFVLVPGRRLHLVVDDGHGVPLAGVRVRAQARGSGSLVIDPDGAPWDTDEHGALVVDDLGDAALDLALSKVGYDDETVRAFEPGGVWFATMVPTPR